eukprot:gene3062-3609_t
MRSVSDACGAGTKEPFMEEYYRYRNGSATRWVDQVPLPHVQARAGPVNWNSKGAVTKPTSQVSVPMPASTTRATTKPCPLPLPRSCTFLAAALTNPAQGRCATCQAFACVADIEGAWFTRGHPLTKLSEQAQAEPPGPGGAARHVAGPQEMIDCGGGNGY